MRERHVYPNDELFHLWAHGTELDLRNKQGNVYCYGDKVYSYGSHFIMGWRKEARDGAIVFLLNPASYSNTTSGHQSGLRSACTGNGTIIEIPTMYWEDIRWRASGGNIRTYFNNRIQDAMKDANNKRMGYYRRNNAVKQARALADDYHALRFLFAFRVRRELPTIQPPDLTESLARQDERDAIRNERYAAQAKLWNETRKKQAAERELKEIELRSNVMQRMKTWREGKFVVTDYFPEGQLLRIRKDHIETTMGARVLVSDVREFIEFDLPKVKSKLGLRHDVYCGPYHGAIATDSELIIGCHHFKWEEVERLTKELEKTK